MIMDNNKYNFYVGTATGSLLYTTDKPNDIKSAKCEEPSEVTALSFGRTENEIIIGYENGNTITYDTAEKEYIKPLKNLEGEGRVVGIGCFGQSVVIGKSDGIVNIWSGKKNNYFDTNLEEKGTLNSLVCNNFRNNFVGTGGEFNDFKLWNVETHQCVFKAKSLGHDELNLPIPTSIRGITFLPENEHFSACATKEGHVLLYDDRAQRKPVIKFFEKKASYTTIACAFRERQCLVGTTRGYMQLLDMKTGKCVKTFTTFTGSVTGIACDPIEPFVATTSLDRHLRIHNLDTKALVQKVYMKQNLTKILMQPIIKDEPKEEKDKEAVDEEYEEIFNAMETVVSDVKLKKPKRKIVEVMNKSRKTKNKKSKQAIE